MPAMTTDPTRRCNSLLLSTWNETVAGPVPNVGDTRVIHGVEVCMFQLQPAAVVIPTVVVWKGEAQQPQLVLSLELRASH